jgi:hypothetical protein
MIHAAHTINGTMAALNGATGPYASLIGYVTSPANTADNALPKVARAKRRDVWSSSRPAPSSELTAHDSNAVYSNDVPTPPKNRPAHSTGNAPTFFAKHETM